MYVGSKATPPPQKKKIDCMYFYFLQISLNLGRDEGSHRAVAAAAQARRRRPDGRDGEHGAVDGAVRGQVPAATAAADQHRHLGLRLPDQLPPRHLQPADHHVEPTQAAGHRSDVSRVLDGVVGQDAAPLQRRESAVAGQG